MTHEQPEHPDAGAELFTAAERYEVAEPGLGHALLDRVAEAIEAIKLYPDGWPIFAGWNREPVVRTKATKRFRYRIVYFLWHGEPVILAYAHERQAPGYWKHRYEDMLGS